MRFIVVFTLWYIFCFSLVKFYLAPLRDANCITKELTEQHNSLCSFLQGLNLEVIRK